MIPLKTTDRQNYVHERARKARKRFIAALYRSEFENKFDFMYMLVQQWKDGAPNGPEKLVSFSTRKEYNQWVEANQDYVCNKVYANTTLARFWLKAWSRKSRFNEEL